MIRFGGNNKNKSSREDRLKWAVSKSPIRNHNRELTADSGDGEERRAAMMHSSRRRTF